MGDEGKPGADLREQAIAWLVALDCGTADEHAFDIWRNGDPRHAAAFAQAAATWRRTADPRLSVLLDAPSVAEPVPLESRPVRGALSRRAVATGAVAALVGAGAAGAFIAWPRRAYAETAIGQRQTLPLPDGSHAMLNTDTRVAWHFGDTREFWVERGEAALLVRRAAQPFVLRGAAVEARLDGGRYGLRLTPGRVALLVVAGHAVAGRGAATRDVTPGHMLTIGDALERDTALAPDAMAAATAWENGRIVFNGMTLDRAVAEFNRYLSNPIVLRDGDLGTTQLGGEFQIDDPDAFLTALRQSFDIDHRREGDHILLFRKRA